MGENVKGKITGTYCRSTGFMDWTRADNWCKSIGMSLATPKEACPGWDGSTGTGKCANLNNVGRGYHWLDSAFGADSAYGVILTAGIIGYNYRYYDAAYALCY
jgi:hypothetical protein